jgi:putative toxin-antitoxin system antitoxin component (TIGR02293 family)
MSTLSLTNYLGLPQRSEFQVAELVEKGLPLESLSKLKEKGLTYNELSEIIIAPRTLKHRKSRNESLSDEETDRVIRVARIISLGEDVFQDREKALNWLRAADDRLQGRSPMSLLRTEAGGRVVENMLWQIDEGVYS